MRFIIVMCIIIFMSSMPRCHAMNKECRVCGREFCVQCFHCKNLTTLRVSSHSYSLCHLFKAKNSIQLKMYKKRYFFYMNEISCSQFHMARTTPNNTSKAQSYLFEQGTTNKLFWPAATSLTCSSRDDTICGQAPCQGTAGLVSFDVS